MLRESFSRYLFNTLSRYELENVGATKSIFLKFDYGYFFCVQGLRSFSQIHVCEINSLCS